MVELLLQRRLGSGDAYRWRTMLRVKPAQLPIAHQIVALAQRVDARIEWRLTTALGVPLLQLPAASRFS